MRTIADNSKTKGIEITVWKAGDALKFQRLNQEEDEYIELSRPENKETGMVYMKNMLFVRCPKADRSPPFLKGHRSNKWVTGFCRNPLNYYFILTSDLGVMYPNAIPV